MCSSYKSKWSLCLLELFSTCKNHSATLQRQERNQRSVCILRSDIGFGRSVWKSTKQKNKSAKSTGIKTNPVITCWEHIDSLEWDYVLSFSISPLKWLQHLLYTSKILSNGRWAQLISSSISKSLGLEYCMHQKPQIKHSSQDLSPSSPGFLQINTAN